MSQITTHVLDISIGRPAAGVPVTLEIEKTGGGWKETEPRRDGWRRAAAASGGAGLARRRNVPPDVRHAAYFDSRKIEGLYPQVNIVFQVRDAKQNYHIPLLLSPYGYSTYRGS